MKHIVLPLAIALAMLAADPLRSQSADPLLLWPEGAPGALGERAEDRPTLTPYLADPSRATGAAIVICPGGGYGGLAGHEGHDYALWFNQQGISAFVLRYRLGSHGYRHPIMLQDAARAVRWVRHHAAGWSIDPQRIGIIGSSAGGHLASTLVTQFDAGQPDAVDPVERHSSRPDLGILCYPVITMGEFTHRGSRQNLLGPDPAAGLIRQLSNELQVTRDTPPCFVWHTWEDPVVPVENSLQFAAALRRAGVPFDLHVYQLGRHGLGLDDRYPFDTPHPWVADLRVWLRVQGFVR